MPDVTLLRSKRPWANVVDGLEGALGEKTEVLRDTLQNKIKDFDDTFSDKARQLDAAIGEKMGQFDTNITAKAKTFYQTLDKAGSDIDRTMLERTRAIEANMQRQSSQLDVSLQRQASQVDSTVSKGIEAVQRSNENITTQSLRTLDGLTQQGESLRDISEGLLGQIRDLTERFDQQGQSIMRAAHELESSSFRIDTVLEARHAELSSLLDDVSSQADALDSVMRGEGRPSSGANLRERYTRAAQEIGRDSRSSHRPTARHIESQDSGRSLEIEHMRSQLSRDFEPVTG